MKTSNKILLGFVLFAITLQTTCIVIAHNASNDKPKQPTVLQEIDLEKPFTTLYVKSHNIAVSLIKSDENNATITDYFSNAKGDYQISIENDTCFINTRVEGFENVNITIKSNKVRNIIIKESSTLSITGTYDSLNVKNYSSLFSINQNDQNHVRHLKIEGFYGARNNLSSIENLDISLRNSKADITNIKNLIKTNITETSELRIKGMPNFSPLVKDENSRISFY